MNSDVYLDGTWKLDFKSASDGFIKEQKRTIQDAGTQALYADISSETVPEDARSYLMAGAGGYGV